MTGTRVGSPHIGREGTASHAAGTSIRTYDTAVAIGTSVINELACLAAGCSREAQLWFDALILKLRYGSSRTALSPCSNLHSNGAKPVLLSSASETVARRTVMIVTAFTRRKLVGRIRPRSI